MFEYRLTQEIIALSNAKTWQEAKLESLQELLPLDQNRPNHRHNSSVKTKVKSANNFILLTFAF